LPEGAFCPGVGFIMTGRTPDAPLTLNATMTLGVDGTMRF